jgi:hypothetical protein
LVLTFLRKELLDNRAHLIHQVLGQDAGEIMDQSDIHDDGGVGAPRRVSMPVAP